MIAEYRRPGHSAPLFQFVVVAVLVLLVTVPVVRNGFVNLDDFLYVGNNSVRQGLTVSGAMFAFWSVSDLYWHPLAWLSHQVDVELFGMNAAGHHLTSVLLHSLTAALFCLVLIRMGAKRWIAAAGALLWAVHPLRVESFAWVAERKDVLCALFYIAAILAYLRHSDRPSRRGYLAWFALGVLALMSKPSAVSLPVVLLLLDFWPLRRPASIRRLLLDKVPLIAMSVVVTYLTVYGQAVSGSMSHLATVSLWTRLSNAPIFLLRYVGKVLWPLDLACFYPYDRHPNAALVIGALLITSALTAAAVWQFRRRPWLLVGWLWFLVALLPNLGLLQAGRQSIADRFTHIAMIGVVVAVVFTVSEYAGGHQTRIKIVTAVVCAVVGALALLTYRQIGFWHDSVSLFEHAIAVEDSDYMRGDLATALITMNRDAEAERHLRRALQLNPDGFDYRNNLANILLKTGRLDEAGAEGEQALRLAPNDVSVAETMALIRFREGRAAEALKHFDHAVRLGADTAPVATALNDMGASLASRGQPGDAEALIRRATQLNPSLVQARRNLVLVLIDQGHPDDARAALNEAIRDTGPRPEYGDLIRDLALTR